MFTDSNTTEATWFLMSSKTAEPNTISLPWNFCCIVIKFIEMRNNYKMKNSDSQCAGQWHISLGTKCQGTEISARWLENCKIPATTTRGTPQQTSSATGLDHTDPTRTVLAVWRRVCNAEFTIFIKKKTIINQASLARKETLAREGETQNRRQRFFFVCLCWVYLHLYIIWAAKKVTFSPCH